MLPDRLEVPVLPPSTTVNDSVSSCRSCPRAYKTVAKLRPRSATPQYRQSFQQLSEKLGAGQYCSQRANLDINGVEPTEGESRTPVNSRLQERVSEISHSAMAHSIQFAIGRSREECRQESWSSGAGAEEPLHISLSAPSSQTIFT